MNFNDWEDDEQQRHGAAFEFEERDDPAEPLVPHRGPLGLVIDDPRGLVPIMPDGPLSFVEQSWFNALIGGLILANVVVLGAELTHRHETRSFMVGVASSLFLVLYCIELGLRIAHFKWRFFWGTVDAPWNWVDLVIVVSGICDEWILQWLGRSFSQGWAFLGLRLLQPVRILFRAVRFLRILRLARVLILTDLHWVESSQFQSIVGLVIVLNAVTMGIETDLKSPVWFWVEQSLLMFFVLELFFRIRLSRLGFFSDSDDRGWNALDFMIVLSGVFDQWVLEAWRGLTQQDVSQGSNGNLGKMMMLARMLRLMRILRLVRVVKAIRPLRQLAIGVVRAMQSMFWVLVLTFVALYSLAILTTRMIGWGQLVDDPDSIPPESREMFASMPDSMFTLFAFMNGHEWHKVRPLLDMLPWMKPVFVAFTICGSWALLSVMTGVVSDHIQFVREEQQREDDEAREERREQLTMTLSQIFASADRDGQGYLSRDAFMEIFNSPYQVRRLQRAINQPLADVSRIFDWLDVEGKGFVGFREFCEGLDCLEETVTGQRLLKVDSAIKLQCSALQKNIDSAAAEVHDLQVALKQQHVELMAKIEAVLYTAEDEAAAAHAAAVQRSGSKPGVAQGADGSVGAAAAGIGRSPAGASSSSAHPGVSLAPPPERPGHVHPMKLMRSTSSLKSFNSTGTPKNHFRFQKSVSFSENHVDLEVMTE